MASTLVGVVLGPVGAEWGTPIPLLRVQPQPEDECADSCPWQLERPQVGKDAPGPTAALIDPTCMVGPAAAAPPSSAAPPAPDGAPPLEPSKKRRRRRTPVQALTEEQLDALHPGNVRHRSVLLLLQPAMRAYEQWLQGRGGDLPWPQEAQQRQLPQVKENNEMVCGDAEGPDRRADDVEGGRHVDEAATAGLRDAAPSSGSERDLDAAAVSVADGSSASARTNWPALYALRHTLKPKIHLPASCPAGAAAGAADEQLPTLPCCCQDAHTLGQDLGPEEAAASEQSTPPSSSDLVAFNLFGSVVSNAFCQPLLVTAHEDTVVLPPRSRFLMSCGVGTLGPLLQVGGKSCDPAVKIHQTHRCRLWASAYRMKPDIFPLSRRAAATSWS